MVAIHLVGREDHQIHLLVLGIAHDGLRPLADQQLLADRDAGRLETLLEREQPGRGPCLQAAIEICHLTFLEVLDGLDHPTEDKSPTSATAAICSTSALLDTDCTSARIAMAMISAAAAPASTKAGW